MSFYAVDEVEAGVARLVDDDGRDFTLPLRLLPPDTRPGDVLWADAFGVPGAGLLRWRRDDDERRRREEHARSVLRRLRAADPGGDVEL